MAAARIEREYARSEGEARKKWLLESLALFRGLRLEQLLDAAEEGWEAELRHTLRPEMADLVARQREAGWRVLIVTASPAEAVLRGAHALGVPEGDVLAIRLEADADGVCTGRPSPIMPLTWRDGKAAALDACGLSGRLLFAAGNSMDDLPMLRRSRGAGMLCTPRPTAEEDPWGGAAEGAQRIAAVAAAEGYWLHEATQGAAEYRWLEQGAEGC